MANEGVVGAENRWKELGDSEIDIILEECGDIFSENWWERDQDNLCSVLRLLRNLCTKPVNQRKTSEHEWLRTILQCKEVPVESVVWKPFLQFICNFVTNNSDNQQKLWQEWFPQTFLWFTTLPRDEDVTHVLLVLLYNITVKDPVKLRQLCSTSDLLVFIASQWKSLDDRIFEWAVMFARLFIRSGELERVYEVLKWEEEAESVSEKQLDFLRMINETVHALCIEKRYTDWRDIIPIRSVHFLIAKLARTYRSIEGNRFQNESLVQAFFLLLEILGDLTSSIHECEEMQQAVYESNLVLLCIDIFHKAANLGDTEYFKGLKVSLVRILGNLSYRHYSTQEAIRNAGGLELILNHTKIDPANEYIREWSVLALRNLCEDNNANQAFIQSLQAQRVVETPEELNAAGISCDVIDGKLAFKGPKTN